MLICSLNCIFIFLGTSGNGGKGNENHFDLGSSNRSGHKGQLDLI